MNTEVQVVPYPPDGILIKIGNSPALPVTKEAALRLAEMITKIIAQ